MKRRPVLEVKHLQLLDAICEAGSVTGAGSRLHLTQSAISHQLKQLENALGIRLFERVGRRVEPTPVTTHIRAQAIEILSRISRLEMEAAERSVSAACRRTIRLSTECYTCYPWLSPVLVAFRRSCPNVDVQIVLTATRRPIEALLKGDIDVAIASTPIQRAGVVSRPLFDDELVVLVPPGHRLCRRSFVAAEDFAGESLYTYDLPWQEIAWLKRFMTTRRFAPAAIHRVPLTEAIIEFVKAGYGLSVIGRWAVQRYASARELVCLPLTSRGTKRRWSVMYPRRAEDDAIRQLVAAMTRESPSGRQPSVGLSAAST